MPQLSPLTSHFSPPSPAALPYNPALSLWLSVDPLSDKYPGESPYVYCGNNPVGLVDKDGRTFYEVGDERKSINDGYDNITVSKITQRQFNRLEKRFAANNMSGYYRLSNKLQKRNGYYETSDMSGTINEDGSTQLAGVKCSFSAPPSILEKVQKTIRKIDEGGSGDYRDRMFAEKSESYVTSGALLLPPVSMTNNICTLTTGQDIYGSQADGVDYTLSSIGIVAHPTKFLKNAVGKGAQWADRISTGVTFWYNQRKNKKNGK